MDSSTMTVIRAEKMAAKSMAGMAANHFSFAA
jgi:hypothetical protein